PTCPASCFVTGRPPPRSTLFPYTTLFRSGQRVRADRDHHQHIEQRINNGAAAGEGIGGGAGGAGDHQAITAVAVHEAAVHACLRSEEHTSELQSRENLVCRLLLEKKNRDR